MALASLDEYMPTVGDDITKFNEFVEEQVALLRARGCETHDLTVNLFKAYAMVKDSKFREYISQKESEYEETNEELPYKKLMLFAENKFKIRKVRHQWNAPTQEEEKIIALEAYIKKIDKGGFAKKTPKNAPRNTEKKKQPKQDKKRNYEPEAWMLVAPKGQEPKKKSVAGKDWHWCPAHKKWTRHTPEECKGVAPRKGEGKAKDRQLKLARAVSALAEESEEE